MSDKTLDPDAAGTRPATALSGMRSLAHMKQFHMVENFRIGGNYKMGEEGSYEFGAEDGTTLESLDMGPLRAAYIAVGSPQRDERGKITNAVIISPYYSGDATWFYYFWHAGHEGNAFSLGPVVGPGQLIDTNKYYVVFLDALGIWGASKPSEGLGMRFPEYTVFDGVQANYRLLVDELNVAKVKLATGVSMGAMQSYVWALLHPGFVEAIMPIGGSTSTKRDPVLRWIFELMTAAIMSDPVWRETKGDYYHLPKAKHPADGIMFGWSILMHNGYDLDYRFKQGWEEVKQEVFSWDPQADRGALLREKAREYDANDLLMRNRSQDRYDINEYLGGISAKTLILHVKNDLWLRVRQAEESAKLIPGADFAAFDSPLAHYAVFQAPNILKDHVLPFFREIGM